MKDDFVVDQQELGHWKMNVRMTKKLFLYWGKKIISSYLDNNAHRHSLYEPSPQNSPKNKRTEIVHPLHSAGTNNITPKVSLPKDQRLSREGKYILRF